MVSKSKRAELDNLIEHAIVDSKLSKKEIEVLKRKAQEIGIPEDEFLIELDALKHKTRTEKKEGLFSSIKKNKYLSSTITILVLVGIIVIIPSKDKRLSKYLTKYEFEDARSLIGKYSESKQGKKLQQIISVEIPYYLQNDATDFAIKSLQEYQFSAKIKTSPFNKNHITNDTDYKAEREWYNKMAFIITNNLALNGKYSSAYNFLNRNFHKYKTDKYYGTNYNQFENAIENIERALLEKGTKKDIKDYYINKLNEVKVRSIDNVSYESQYNSEAETYNQIVEVACISLATKGFKDDAIKFAKSWLRPILKNGRKINQSNSLIVKINNLQAN